MSLLLWAELECLTPELVQINGSWHFPAPEIQVVTPWNFIIFYYFFTKIRETPRKRRPKKAEQERGTKQSQKPSTSRENQGREERRRRSERSSQVHLSAVVTSLALSNLVLFLPVPVRARTPKRWSVISEKRETKSNSLLQPVLKVCSFLPIQIVQRIW